MNDLRQHDKMSNVSSTGKAEHVIVQFMIRGDPEHQLQESTKKEKGHKMRGIRLDLSFGSLEEKKLRENRDSFQKESPTP